MRVLICYEGPISSDEYGYRSEVVEFDDKAALESYVYSMIDGATVILLFNADTGERIYVSDV